MFFIRLHYDYICNISGPTSVGYDVGLIWKQINALYLVNLLAVLLLSIFYDGVVVMGAVLSKP